MSTGSISTHRNCYSFSILKLLPHVETPRTLTVKLSSWDPFRLHCKRNPWEINFFFDIFLDIEKRFGYRDIWTQFFPWSSICQIPWRDLNFLNQPLLATNVEFPSSFSLKSNDFSRNKGLDIGRQKFSIA